jgi:hypothetical protein
MNPRRILILVIFGVLLLCLAVGSGAAQQPSPESAQPDTSEGVSAATAVGSRIFYQGLLKQDGEPVTGVKDLVFKLFSNSMCTTQVGSDIVKNDVPVANGLFQVYLDVDSSSFNGQALWLKVLVDGTDLGACQEILPVPYALSLRPGATIEDNSSSSLLNVYNYGSGKGIHAYSTNGTAAIHGESPTNYGVWGIGRYGVFGLTFEEGGLGVYGRNGSETGDAIGVRGTSDSTEGTAGWFENTATTGTTRGIYALTNSPGGTAITGYSYTTAAGGGATGVSGLTNASLGNGVKGFSQSLDGGHGVYAQSKGPGYLGAALWAQADHTSGIAIWGKNTSDDSTLVLENYGAGDLIKAFTPSVGELRFRVDNNGRVYADGGYAAEAADMAEMLTATDDLEAGDVLVIGVNGSLARSTQAFQTSVVGVYSTKPGYVGGYSEGAGSEGRVPLAVAGIVPVKVCTENGPIQPGDLLVSASMPGYAMRAGDDPAPGTVIGKALGSLAESQGLIQMLVMLR